MADGTTKPDGTPPVMPVPVSPTAPAAAAEAAPAPSSADVASVASSEAPKAAAVAQEAAAAPTAPADIPTALESFGKKDETAKPEQASKAAETPAEAAKPAAADAKPGEQKPDQQPAEPPKPEPLAPVDYKYTIPDTIRMDDARKGEFHAALDSFRANPAEGAQALVDMHNKSMEAHDQELRAGQISTFNDTRKGWRTQIMADPEIGGAGHQTAVQAIARMRDLLVPAEFMQPRKWDDGSPRISAFEEFLRVTGAGDHPIFNRLLHNAARYLDEPQARNVPVDIKPSKTNGRGRGGMYSEESRQKMNGL